MGTPNLFGVWFAEFIRQEYQRCQSFAPNKFGAPLSPINWLYPAPNKFGAPGEKSFPHPSRLPAKNTILLPLSEAKPPTPQVRSSSVSRRGRCDSDYP
jgi:hypothetical protein